MTVAPRNPEQDWTAERFLETDQHEFGNAWRYELVGGRIVGHAAPSPEHGAIVAGLTGALGSRVRGNRDGCHPESGSGADAVLQLSSVGLAIPLSEVYAFADLPEPDQAGGGVA